MGEEIKRKLEAAIEAFSDERVRWFLGMSRKLVDSDLVTDEWLEEIVHDLIQNELEIHLILSALEKEGLLTEEEIAEKTKLSRDRVSEHIKVLLFLNEIVAGEKGGNKAFEISPILKEDRRRCPCEALIRHLLK